MKGQRASNIARLDEPVYRLGLGYALHQTIPKAPSRKISIQVWILSPQTLDHALIPLKSQEPLIFRALTLNPNPHFCFNLEIPVQPLTIIPTNNHGSTVAHNFGPPPLPCGNQPSALNRKLEPYINPELKTLNPEGSRAQAFKPGFLEGLTPKTLSLNLQTYAQNQNSVWASGSVQDAGHPCHRPERANLVQQTSVVSVTGFRGPE